MTLKLLQQRSYAATLITPSGGFNRKDFFHAVNTGKELAKEYVHKFYERIERGATGINLVNTGFDYRAVQYCGRDIRMRKTAYCVCLFMAAQEISVTKKLEKSGRRESDGVKTIWATLIKELAILFFHLTSEERAMLFDAFRGNELHEEWERHLRGAIREAMVANAALKAGAIVRLSYSGLDVRWGVDLLMEHSSGSYGVQVKPPIGNAVVDIHIAKASEAADQAVFKGVRDINRRHQTRLIPLMVHFSLDDHQYRLESDALEIAFSMFFSRR